MAEKEDRVIETRLGKLPVTEERIIRFPRGLIGFESMLDFTLLQIKEGSPFLMLQSLDDPRLGLLVADPFAFIPEYEVKVGDAEMRLLGIDDVRQVAVLVTVTIPPGQPGRTTLNLTGPILVNIANRVGVQIPQTDTRFPSHYLLHESGKGREGAQAASEGKEKGESAAKSEGEK